MRRTTVRADDHSITVHIPLTTRPRPRLDNAMVKALAWAFRWWKMLDEGVDATLDDLARAKGVNATYVSRILRLTLLAPAVVEAILWAAAGGAAAG